MQDVGFEDMEVYVLKRYNTDAQYIETRPILDLCKEMVQMTGMWVAKRWWQQEVTDLAGMRVEEAASAEEDGGEEETEGGSYRVTGN